MLPETAEALFFDPGRHLDALAMRAWEHVEKGEYVAAFQYADRRCRLSRPSARDYLLRSEISRRAGFADGAAADLARALEIDPTDRLVLRTARNWGDAEQQASAERLLEAEEHPADMSLRPTVARGEGHPSGQDAADANLATRAHDSALLSIVVPVYEDFDATRACLEALHAQRDLSSAQIIVVDDSSPNLELRHWLDDQAAAGWFTLLRNEANAGFAASVNRALAFCPAGDVILVNADALPAPTSLSRLAKVAAASPDIGTVTPLSNNGEYTSFPAPNSVNPLGGPEDVARLDRLAEEANGLDFVDLPNGVGFCLYITRACLDAVGPLPEIYMRGYYEDVEFCLRAREKGFRNVCAAGVYVGHAGARSFRADKRGLVVRNLAVLTRRFPSYQIESATFLEADPLRAARSAMEARAPSDRETVLLLCGAGGSRLFAEERARDLANRSETGGPVPLICACDGWRAELRGAQGLLPRSLEFRIDERPARATLVAYLRAKRIVRIEVFDPLALPLPILSALSQLHAEFEIVGADLEWAVGLRSPRNGVCQAPDGARPCPDCAAGAYSVNEDEGVRGHRLKRKRALLSRARSIRPADRMAGAFARHIFGEKLVAAPEAPELIATPIAAPGGALAIIAPLPDPLADRVIVALGRGLRQMDPTARIVVLGACVNDLAAMSPGNVFVAGAVDSGEYARLLRQYDVCALMSPYRTRFFGRVDGLSRQFALAKAYFDFSFSKLPEEDGDLALDPRICDSKAAALAAAWFLARSGKAE